MSPVPTVSSSLYHLITGAGLALILQTNITVSVSLMVWLLGALITLTGTNNEKKLIKYLIISKQTSSQENVCKRMSKKKPVDFVS